MDSLSKSNKNVLKKICQDPFKGTIYQYLLIIDYDEPFKQNYDIKIFGENSWR